MLALATQLGRAVPSDRPDLTMQQLHALVLLSARPRHVGEVATLLGVSMSSASSMIDRLARASLVERERGEDDRRVVVCGITEQGELVLRHVLEVGRLRLERLLAELSSDELTTVERALESLIAAARTVMSGSSPSMEHTRGGLPGR